MPPKPKLYTRNASNIPSDEIIERYNAELRINGNDKNGAIINVTDSYKDDFHEEQYYLIQYYVTSIVNKTT